MRKILIIGLGLIGGSLGLALKQQRPGASELPYYVTGYDISRERLEQAWHRGAIDQASESMAVAVQDAEVILLSTPALAIRQVLAELAPVLPNGALVTDTASTKTQVVQWANELLPAYAVFIGGHPMAGGTGSLEEARPDLFTGAIYCVVLPTDASARSASATLEPIYELIATIGAMPLLIEAITHDRIVAAISHLPMLASAALVETVTTGNDQELLRQLASTGFRDTTRVAAGDPIMYHDILLTNRAALLPWLDAYIERLQELQHLLQKASLPQDGRLLTYFARAQAQRKKLMGEKRANSS